MRSDWDYLIITAANEVQAAAYREQVQIRQNLGLISGVGNILVVPDPSGRRVGSGGSTILCLIELINRELNNRGNLLASARAWEELFQRLRVLIIHGGGDARRLPSYSACGKIFIPVPGESDSALGLTLLDRQLPHYLGLPSPLDDSGQVVVTTGDVYLDFDASNIRFRSRGVTGIGCFADPQQAAAHGVFCPTPDGAVRRFLQKPPVEDQARHGAIDRHGRSVLDIGIMSLDASSVTRLLSFCTPKIARDGRLAISGRASDIIGHHSLDFYREICCAMGLEKDLRSYIDEVRRTGSSLSDRKLEILFDALSKTPFSVETVPRCIFLHFGTMRQLIASGADLISLDNGVSNSGAPIVLNSGIDRSASILGKEAWVEGCRVGTTLILGGENIIIGVDVDQPLALPRRACLDILEGHDRSGKKIWFLRCFDIDDLFHLPADQGGRLNGLALNDWLSMMKAKKTDIWDQGLAAAERNVWNGRFFPGFQDRPDVAAWLWMFDLSASTEAQKKSWRISRRFSLAEMARHASLGDFHARRSQMRAVEIRGSLGRAFRRENGFSAADLSFFLHSSSASEKAAWLAAIIKNAFRQHGPDAPLAGIESLGLSRILHTVGTALAGFPPAAPLVKRSVLVHTGNLLTLKEKTWLESLGLSISTAISAASWGQRAQQAAFERLGKAIVLSSQERLEMPKNALREDEIVWGRAPARLDLGGGWTDTPPYSLENGGCVINAAVNLNGQAPIQAYGRVIPEPEIRISSIDHSVRLVIKDLDELLDYRQPASRFGLAKAALALSGFSPASATWPKRITLRRMLEEFGGGIELTTLAAIPSGSGLGTSSIMGAVLLSVICRMTGRNLSHRELFHGVLRLEQELTTGGGWQDQVGGVIGDVKLIRTGPGMIPDPLVHFVPADVLDPQTNGGSTLLYYTGLRRLAKNILADVVGSYLSRDRRSIKTLRDLHAFPPIMAEAMAQKSLERFGRLIDLAWRLNKALDPESTTPVIEEILGQVGFHVHGAKLLGAGGGGFLLMVGKTPDDAQAVRRLLRENPPNKRARFFDFDINREGLVVTVS